MKTTALKLVTALAIAALPSISQAAPGRDAIPPRPSPSSGRWAVGLGGTGYEIRLSKQGKPILTAVESHLPVLYYAGVSGDGRFQAYTTLEALDETAPEGRRPITAKELHADRAARLVPSGDLFAEDQVTGSVYRIDNDGQYVVAAAWSPANPNLIAYTFSTGSEFGVAVADITTGVSRILRPSGILADYLTWSVPGLEVHLFEEAASKVLFDLEGHTVHVFAGAQIPVSPENVLGERAEWSAALPKVNPTEKLMGTEQPFHLALEGGYQVKGQNLLGFSELTLADAGGNVVRRVQAQALVATLPTGIVFKRFAMGRTELSFLSATGEVHELVSTKAAVTYKLPFHHGSSPDMTVTQVGSGLSTKCNVFSHTGNLAYAYDMQAKADNEDILTAGAGTVAHVYKAAACNSLDNGSDGTICADYSSSCSSNGGWGNVVILQHADGTWTKYAHLKNGTVVPSTLGRSAGIGCKLAREGHTGNTTGNKNGCGDHLHFQRQTSSSRDGAPTSTSFSDATSPLSCKSYESGNAGSSCTF